MRPIPQPSPAVQMNMPGMDADCNAERTDTHCQLRQVYYYRRKPVESSSTGFFRNSRLNIALPLLGAAKRSANQSVRL